MPTIPKDKPPVKPESLSHGFFSVPRDISNLSFFNEKKITKHHALIYLISHAAFKNNTIELERQNCKIKIKISRNEVFTTKRELKKRWRRSLGWIDRFLLNLEDKKLIEYSIVETSLKTQKQVHTLGSYRKGKTGPYRNIKTRQLGIRVKLLFLDDLDKMKKQKQINEVLAKQVHKKNEKRTP